MRDKVPLVYFHGLVSRRYLAVWPVFIIANDPRHLTFTVVVDERYSTNFYMNEEIPHVAESNADARRIYITSSVKQRLHQGGFRERGLNAYREQCAFCRLKHLELLDAAHIIPDGEPGGDPIVNNGVALCRLHHAAFDRFMIGIRPDYVIKVRDDILKEKDGPMLLHRIQSMHLKKIILRRNSDLRPHPELLEQRYEGFPMAG